MNPFKKLIKQALSACGLKIYKVRTEFARLQPPNPLVYHKVDLLLDVGANVGQYVIENRQQGYLGQVVSFEPLPDAYQTLRENAYGDTEWVIHERCAVGSEIGQTEINISKNSFSSSLLPMLETHSDSAPESVYIGTASTPVITLDSVYERYAKDKKKVFLKIDTQGFEAHVLAGALKSLQSIFAVQLELSLVPLYANQELYPYFLKFFEEQGFYLWQIIPGFIDNDSGQSLQFDAIFLRKQPN
jgi:FkbM family methyltransferase